MQGGYSAVLKGIGDGGQRQRGHVPPPKNGGIFGGKFYVKFGHFSGKNHVKLVNFEIFRANIKKSGISIIFQARIM